MKFSKLWLNELINIDITTEKLAEQLTMVGLEVAAIQPVAEKFSGVVVGEVLEVMPHPNADKLTICQVNVGGDQSSHLTIVCGAKNVRAGIKVPVALIGAELPNDFKIKAAKLRGVDSSGMLCSASELGLPESPGLLELPDDAPIGMDIRKYLALDDEVVEIELTSNRGDCLSMLGVAREVAAINRIKLNKFETTKFVIDSEVAMFPVSVVANEACSHYYGRIIRGINNNICAPFWMQERLRRSGLRSVNLVVDITNYVMLEMGQPLHAFDLARLDRQIEVRYAANGESLELLDGRTVELNSETLVIADASKCLAMAGVMGGKDTGVLPNTTDIFLESAFFTPEKIVGVARSYNLQTDSSYRFERGIDWQMQRQALDRATQLIVEIAGGAPGAVSEVVFKEQLAKSAGVLLRRESIGKILGITVSDADVASILLHLGVEFTVAVDGWKVVSVPSWRHDLKIEEDLVEEIARIFGYDQIPEQKVVAELGVTAEPNLMVLDRDSRNRLYALMEDRGYHEVVTYSFISEKLQELFNPNGMGMKLSNPISSELTVMRSTLWPGLINAVQYNHERQQQRARFFEIGLRFLKQPDALEQKLAIAGVTFGGVYPEQWGIKQIEQADFFDLKADVTAILKQVIPEDKIEYISRTHDALHPLRSAEIRVDGISVGFLGEIHPLIKQKLELTKQICLFEINLGDLTGLASKLRVSFKRFSRFPKVQRDLAVIVNKEISWVDIRQKIVDISGELLHNVDLFDVYCNENIGLDKRSMAIRLIFQSVDRTLVDTEVESVVSHIVSVLKQTFSASLRG